MNCQSYRICAHSQKVSEFCPINLLIDDSLSLLSLSCMHDLPMKACRIFTVDSTSLFCMIEFSQIHMDQTQKQPRVFDLIYRTTYFYFFLFNKTSHGIIFCCRLYITYRRFNEILCLNMMQFSTPIIDDDDNMEEFD